MRRTIVATLLGLAALPALAGVPAPGGAAASPVSTQPLAANEVLLELSGIGTAVSRADLATVTVPFIGRGATDEAARRAYDAEAARLRAAARAAGVAAADIEVQPPVSMGMTAEFVDADMSMDMDASVEPVSDEAAAPEPSYVVSGEIAIRLSDSSQAEAVDVALRAVDSSLAPNVAYTVSDDGPARRGARADAIAAARADADAYAAAMNMRVVRIVRVTERIGMDIMSMLIGNPALAQLMEQVAQPDGPDQVVRAFVGVDFALAPR